MKSGKLRHSVTVKLPATALGTRGQISGDDTTVATKEPCSIETLSGRELEQARQLYAAATHRVVMRRNNSYTLTTQHYLAFGSRTLNIGFIDNLNQLDYELHVLCGEKVA